jgi:hypothetical protein
LFLFSVFSFYFQCTKSTEQRCTYLLLLPPTLFLSPSLQSALLLREDSATVAPPSPVYSTLVRSSSLPTETEEEWRKRKELQTLRRMEAKRRRSEKQKVPKPEREVAGGGCGSEEVEGAGASAATLEFNKFGFQGLFAEGVTSGRKRPLLGRKRTSSEWKSREAWFAGGPPIWNASGQMGLWN